MMKICVNKDDNCVEVTDSNGRLISHFTNTGAIGGIYRTANELEDLFEYLDVDYEIVGSR